MTGGAIPLHRGLAALSVVAALPAVTPAASSSEHGKVAQGEDGSGLRVPWPGERALGEAMWIDWMTRDEMVQSVPPANTEVIGRQLIPWQRKAA